MDRRRRIYLAGPYSEPDPCVNTRRMIDAADKLLMAGFNPFVPLLSHLWHTVSPKPYETWMALDLEWVAACDGLFRLPGESPGADREEAEARRLRIPVFRQIHDLVTYFHPRGI